MNTIIDDLTLIEYIDAGCMGETYLSKKKDSDKYYATKRISVTSLYEEPILLQNIQNEIMVLKTVKHPNIVKLYDVKVKKDYIYLVMEYCNGGSLLDALIKYKERNGKPFTEDIVKFLMRQILSAVKCLHKHGIIHKDLNLENILLNYENEYERYYDNIFLSQIKIIDFDLCSKSGTYIETFMDNDYDDNICDEKVDIWALGIICYEMLTGIKPYQRGEKDYLTKKYNIKIPKNISLKAQSFLLSMLQNNRDLRLNAIDLLNHDFLKTPDIKNNNHINQNNKFNLNNDNYHNLNELNSLEKYKIYTPDYTNKNKSIYGLNTIDVVKSKKESFAKYQIKSLPQKNNQKKSKIQTISSQRHKYTLKNPQPLFRKYQIGEEIDNNEEKIIVKYCKFYYMQMKGEKSIAKRAAEALKQKLGNDWLIMISNLKCGEFNFSLSPAKNGDFIVFSLDNQLFQVCRY